MAEHPDLKIAFVTPLGAHADVDAKTIHLDFRKDNGDRLGLVVHQSQLDILMVHIESARKQLPAPFGPESKDKD